MVAMDKDSLFTNQNYNNDKFLFNKDVASVFNDMINRSIPLFSTIHNLILDICLAHFKSRSLKVLDLGCSTGSFLNYLIHHKLSDNKVSYLGIDQSKDMLDILHSKYKDLNNISIATKCISIDPLLKFFSSDVVVVNLVLQFIPVENRIKILRNIYNCLSKDSCCFVVEKVFFDNSDFQDISRNVYHEFKYRKGYSKEEIRNKEKSLKNVLIPCSIDKNIFMLKDAGFSYVSPFFQWVNFVGFIAIK
jgi:tRNA (cmo5U34)-methyltransferase